VCGNDSSVNRDLVGVQIGTAVLMRFSVCVCVELTVR
jgi:hypothetical protein